MYKIKNIIFIKKLNKIIKNLLNKVFIIYINIKKSKYIIKIYYI